MVAPRQVQKRYRKKCEPDLRSRCDRPDGDTIKKLRGWRRVYRYRLGEYRVIYRVDLDLRLATILRVGHRRDVYDPIGLDDDGGPSPETFLSAPPDELEEGADSIDLTGAFSTFGKRTPENSSPPLPRTIDEESLEKLMIPSEDWDRFLNSTTEAELLALDGQVPPGALEKVVELLFPSSIEERLRAPSRVASVGEIERLIEGEIGIESLMLVLDPEQREFLDRIKGTRPSGPWMVKGGPGSGKSLLGLYGIERIMSLAAAELGLGKPISVLFTTYTHSLTRTARNLMGQLNVQTPNAQLDIKNVDQVIHDIVPGGNWTFGYHQRGTVSEILRELGLTTKSFSFSATDAEFVLEEIEGVIYGRGVQTLDEYLGVPRAGRGRRLGTKQKRDLWVAFVRLREKLAESNKRLWHERDLVALKAVRPLYDYVFIDEAQDLSLVRLRFLVGLCRSSQGVFIAADSNQSIYGSGLPWREVADDLKFTGRSKIFRKNHRNPKPIWDAIRPFAAGVDDGDEETLSVEAYRDGPEPLLLRYRDDEASAVSAAITQMCESRRLPHSHCVVLAPTRAITHRIADGLPNAMRARAMASKDFDITHAGVKVTTFHAAKGLEFPIVVVAGLADGVFPHSSADGDPDKIREGRRLLFVASSRATQQLAFVAPMDNPSRFLDYIDRDQWLIKDHSPD